MKPSVHPAEKRKALLRGRMTRFLYCKDRPYPLRNLESEMCRYYADRTFPHDEVRRWVQAIVNSDSHFVKAEAPLGKTFGGQPVREPAISLQEHCRHPGCVQRRVHNF